MTTSALERQRDVRAKRATSARLSAAALLRAQICKPVGSYERISKDRNDGKGAALGVKRQRQENVDYFDRLDYSGNGVEFYRDNDKSGWDPNVIRDDFDRLLKDIRAGRLRAVVAWHSDRFTRQPAQLEALWAACKASNTELHTVLGGHITDITMLRIQGALSAQESDIKSARATLKHEELAEMGEFHGGRRRFGYQRGMVEGFVDVEAEAIRQCAERFLAGESLYSLAKFLNEYEWEEKVKRDDDTVEVVKHVGLPTPGTGREWTGPNVRNMLRRPHLAGLRVHHAEVISEAAWDGIITRDTHDAIVARLNDPSRKTTTGNARVYLLAGLARCGFPECNLPVRGRPGNKRISYPTYACVTGRHLSCRASLVDEVVSIEVKAVLAKMREDGVFVDEAETQRVDALHVRRSELEDGMSETARALREGRIKQRGHDRTMLELETELEDVEAQIQQAREKAYRPERALEGMLGPDPAVLFDDVSLSRKRAVINLLFTVTLCGTKVSGRHRFDPLLDVVLGEKLPRQA